MKHQSLGLTAAALFAGALIAGAVPALAQSQSSDADLIARGKYVATLGDCAACHTAPHSAGQDFAGGYAIVSPLGTIWSTNITPSKTYGIGDYSEQDFARAVREGVAKDGTHLYPAMPYDAYAGVTDADIHALYAYFMQGVAPVETPPAHVTALPFPFNLRFSMAAWNLIYAGGKPFTPVPGLTEAQNRGKYLVDTLGHCASCHSPRGLLMGPVSGAYLRGGAVGSWIAPDITADAGKGIGTWSTEDIATYLKTGRAEGRAQAAGPMAEAVEHSFSHLDDTDLNAIAAYLKTVDAGGSGSAASARDGLGQASNIEPAIRGLFPSNAHDSLKTGAEMFSGYCASCHQPDGAGSDNQAYPSLFHNSVVGASDPTNLIATILFGVDREAGDDHVLMPHFGKGSYVAELSNADVAKVATFVRRNFGDTAAPEVTAAEVDQVRHGGPVPFLAAIQPWIGWIIAAALALALIVLGLMTAMWRKTPR